MSHKLISKVQADYWESDYDVKSISPNIKKIGQNHQVKGLFHQDNPLSKYGSDLADKTPAITVLAGESGRQQCNFLQRPLLEKCGMKWHQFK